MSGSPPNGRPSRACTAAVLRRCLAENRVEQSSIALRRSATPLLSGQQLLHRQLPRLRKFLGRRQIIAKVTHQLRAHPRTRYVHNLQRALNQSQLYLDGLTGPHVTRGFCRQIVHRYATCPTRIAGQTASFEDAHCPKPFVEAAGGFRQGGVQRLKAKKAAGVVKRAAFENSG